MSRRERWFVAASLVVGMVLSVVLGSAGVAVFDGALAQGTTDSEPPARMQETAARSAVEVVQQVSPAVVTVINEQRVQQGEQRQLHDNDRLRIGSTTFVIKLLVS